MTDKIVKRKMQVSQTVEWLTEALIQLMERKPYNQITISELTKRSGLSRRTFYRHFSSIDDILVQEINKQIEELFQETRRKGAETFEKGIRVSFEYWLTQRDFLLLLQKNDLMPILLAGLPTYMKYSNINRALIDQNDYFYYFIAGGISNLLILWLEEGAVKSPQDMAKVAAGITEAFQGIGLSEQ
ncbi:MAG: TetR/AcrR family transcriptional regulator [Micrococcaceae bacterium]